MTGNQSRILKVGDRICWHSDSKDQGRVTEKNWAGVIIQWDNGKEQSILHNDMMQIDLVPPNGR